MNRQFLIVALFLLLAVTGYNQFVAVPRLQAEKAAAEQLLKEQASPAVPAAPVAVVVNSKKPALLSKEAAFTPKPEELIVFHAPHAEITFSSKGAGIKTFLFKDSVADVDLTPYKGKGYFATWPEIDFTERSRNQHAITFAADMVPGFEINKTYTFNENGIHNLTLTLNNRTAHDVTLQPWFFNFGPGLATVESEISDNERESKAVYLTQLPGKKHPTLVDFSKNHDETPASGKDWIWAGVENRYFLSVLIPQNWVAGTLVTKKETVTTRKRAWGLFGMTDVKGPDLQINVASETVSAKSSKTLESDFYFGPKDYQQFQTLPFHLNRSIEFGFFGALGKLARNVLETFYGWTGNYGVAIIMLTLLLQLILFKFTMMSFKSTAKMRNLQPEMAALKMKYKGNPEAMNRETMNLYKKHKINPLSGCLPMLIQLPIFLALFNALRTSWSLHGAKFVFWITDLSSKDPYYILPILMGVVMFFQQKNSMPVGTDPAQAAMFKYMPVIFTLLFMNFPSGLVLYWLTNSLITFGIQTIANKKLAKAK